MKSIALDVLSTALFVLFLLLGAVGCLLGLAIWTSCAYMWQAVRWMFAGRDAR